MGQNESRVAPEEGWMQAEWKGEHVRRGGGLAGWWLPWGFGPVSSPAGEAVGCRHYPAGVDKAPSTEAVPNVDGSQPGV